jgi:hypothetical protein
VKSVVKNVVYQKFPSTLGRAYSLMKDSICLTWNSPTLSVSSGSALRDRLSSDLPSDQLLTSCY